MSSRGRLLTEPLKQPGYTIVDARMGFVRCLAAYKQVEEGQDVYLHGECGVPRPYARMLQRIALGLNNAPAPFIGNWARRAEERVTLLVGDRPSYGKADSLPNWPFISGIASGCSVWLTEKLEEYGIPETALCWTNAYDRYGEEIDLTAAGLGQFSQVIALGKQAHAALDRQRIAHVQTYHPQYWKRFHAKHPYHLITQIKGAMT